MAQENVAKFEELLRGDEELQAKLRAAAEAFEGDKTDAKAVFAAVVAPLADEVGLPFTLEEGMSIVASKGEMSDAELEAVAGGTGFNSGYCFFVGGTDEPQADSEDYGGVIVCAYLGFSVFSIDF